MRFVVTKNHEPALLVEAASEQDAELWALRHGYDRFTRSPASLDTGHAALVESLTRSLVAQGKSTDEAARAAALGAGPVPSELLTARLHTVAVPRQEPDARFMDGRAGRRAGKPKRRIDEGTGEHWSGEIMEPARPTRVPRS